MFLVINKYLLPVLRPKRIQILFPPEADRIEQPDSFIGKETFLSCLPLGVAPGIQFVFTAYNILKKVPNVTVWKKEEIPAEYVYGNNPRIGDLVVLPNIGTYLHFRDKSYPYPGATHGYDNFSPEMEAIFYAAGPSFKENVELPVMANVNLYLIISRLLNLEPAPNDGDSVVVNTLFR